MDGLDSRYIAISDFYLTGDDWRQDLLNADHKSALSSETQSQNTEVPTETSTENQDDAVSLRGNQRGDKAQSSRGNNTCPARRRDVGFSTINDAKTIIMQTTMIREPWMKVKE